MGWLYIYIKLNHELYVLVDYYFIFKKKEFSMTNNGLLNDQYILPTQKKKKKKKRDRDSLPT